MGAHPPFGGGGVGHPLENNNTAVVDAINKLVDATAKLEIKPPVLTHALKDGTYTIKPVASKADVLDVSGLHLLHKESNRVIMFNPNGTDNQLFVFKSSKKGNGMYTITPKCCPSRELSTLAAGGGTIVISSTTPPKWLLTAVTDAGGAAVTDAYYITPVPHGTSLPAAVVGGAGGAGGTPAAGTSVRLQYVAPSGLSSHGSLKLAVACESTAQEFRIF